jgi:hypothetical protein
MKGKKGAGHVEVIISFIIFIGFLIFLFTIFNPLDLANNTSLVDSVFLKMEEELTVKVSSVSFNLATVDGINDCFSIPKIEELDCSFERNVRVFDKNGDAVGASLSPGRIRINLAGTPDLNDKKFYTIICAEGNEPSGSPSDCTPLGEEDFELGVISDKGIWSDLKISEFEDDYNGLDGGRGYADLKEEYVPAGSDFGFRVWDLENQEVPLYNGGETPSTRVDARTIPIDVIDENADIEKRTLTILTW